MRAPGFIFVRRNEKTREAWLAECHPAWRSLMAELSADPEEIARLAGITRATLKRVVTCKENRSSYKVVAAVLRNRGHNAKPTFSSVGPEVMHMHYLEDGSDPHPYGEPDSCRFCSDGSHTPIGDRNGLRRSLRRQVQAIAELRRAFMAHRATVQRIAAKYELKSPELERTKCAASWSQSADARELVRRLRAYGLADLIEAVQPDEQRRIEAVRGAA